MYEQPSDFFSGHEIQIDRRGPPPSPDSAGRVVERNSVAVLQRAAQVAKILSTLPVALAAAAAISVPDVSVASPVEKKASVVADYQTPAHLRAWEDRAMQSTSASAKATGLKVWVTGKPQPSSPSGGPSARMLADGLCHVSLKGLDLSRAPGMRSSAELDMRQDLILLHEAAHCEVRHMERLGAAGEATTKISDIQSELVGHLANVKALAQSINHINFAILATERQADAKALLLAAFGALESARSPEQISSGLKAFDARVNLMRKYRLDEAQWADSASMFNDHDSRVVVEAVSRMVHLRARQDIDALRRDIRPDAAAVTAMRLAVGSLQAEYSDQQRLINERLARKIDSFPKVYRMFSSGLQDLAARASRPITKFEDVTLPEPKFAQAAADLWGRYAVSAQGSRAPDDGHRDKQVAGRSVAAMSASP